MVSKGRRVVLQKPSGDECIGRGQHADEGVLGGALGQLGVTPHAMVRRQRLGRSSLSALRVVMMESISLAVSSNLVKRALSLMLALIHLLIHGRLGWFHI